MTAPVEVAIVGAGPMVCHWRDAGVGFPIFGSPVEAWRKHVPEGMLVKSDGFASRGAGTRP
jgi:FAD-dependent urate hydroxylase